MKLAAFAIGLGGGYVAATRDPLAPVSHAERSESESILDEIVGCYRTYWMDGRYLVERPA